MTENALAGEAALRLAEKANNASMAGDMAGAARWLKRAIDLEPTNPVLVAMLAALRRATGDALREDKAWVKLGILSPEMSAAARGVFNQADRWLTGRVFAPPDSAGLVWVPGFRLKKDSTPKKRLRRRLETAVRMARRFADAPVLLSGGLLPGRTRPEGDVMAEYLIAHGLSPSRLIIEDRSRESLENVLFARPLLGARPAVCLISEEPHLSRMCALVDLTGWAGSVAGVAAAPGRLAPADKAATYRDCLRLMLLVKG